MSKLTRDETAQPVSRDEILKYERGQGNIHFPCSANHKQDWQRYTVDALLLLYVMIIHTFINILPRELVYTLLYLDMSSPPPVSVTHVCRTV